MIEIGIGVLFAVLFVTAYLLVSKLLRSGDGGQSRWRELGNHPLGGSKRIESKPPRLFLTTGEMSEHHSKTKGTQAR
jgi:hypothetical protein